MAKIPLYNQGQLASSVVGTPGINEAPMIQAQSNAQSAQAVAGADLAMLKQSRGIADRNITANRTQEDVNREHTHQFFQAVASEVQARSINNQREMNAAQQEMDNQRKALVALQKENQVSTSSADIGMKLDSLSRTLRQGRVGSPTGAADEYVGQARAMLDQQLDQGGYTPEVRAAVQKSGMARIAQEQSKLNDWEVSAGNQKAADDISLNEANAVTTVRDGKGDPEAYASAKKAIDAQQGAYYNRYGQAQGKLRMQKAQATIADDYLQSIVTQQPDTALGLMAKGEFTGVLDDRKLNAFRKEAETTIKHKAVDAYVKANHEAQLESLDSLTAATQVPKVHNDPMALNAISAKLEQRKAAILAMPDKEEIFQRSKELKMIDATQSQINTRVSNLYHQATRAEHEHQAEITKKKNEQVKLEKQQTTNAFTGIEHAYKYGEELYQHSPEAEKVRTELFATMGHIRADESGYQIYGKGYNRKQDVMRDIVQARDLLYKSHEMGLTMTGDVRYEAGIEKLTSFIQRQKNNLPADKRSLDEHAAEYILQGAPPVVHRAHNPFQEKDKTDSIDAEFARNFHTTIQNYRNAGKGDKLTPDGLNKIYNALALQHVKQAGK